MQDGVDGERGAVALIDHHVWGDEMEMQWQSREVGAAMADAGCFGEFGEGADQLFEGAVREFFAGFLGQVEPDSIEVVSCQRGDKIRFYALRFCACRRSARTFRSWSPGMPSPRSI